MSIALPTLPSRPVAPRPLPVFDIASAITITGTLIIATVTTATAGALPRTGAAIMDLGLLGLAGRRQRALAVALVTVLVVIVSVLITPNAIKAPALAGVALVAYSLVRYESGHRSLAGLVLCLGGVSLARFVLPAERAHGITITQLLVVLVLIPAAAAALITVRARLIALLWPGLLDSWSPADAEIDHLRDPGRAARWLGSAVGFVRTQRDRLLSITAAGLVLLVLILNGAGASAALRDLSVLGLAVISVGSLALLGRWPWPALLVALAAAVAVTGIASLPDAYNGVIGGVVIIGLPLMVGGLLDRPPSLFALGACLTAIVIMDLVGGSCYLATVAGGTNEQRLLASLALAVGAWSAGRVLRHAGEAVWGSVRFRHAAGLAGARPYPDARELVNRSMALGLRPTTIRVDPMPCAGALPVGEVVRQVLDEAVDNAARHAPGATLMIKVLQDSRAIRIEVLNGPAAWEAGDTRGRGRGVPALADSIAAVGGMFWIGPASGGYALRARLPISTKDEPIPEP